MFIYFQQIELLQEEMIGTSEPLAANKVNTLEDGFIKTVYKRQGKQQRVVSIDSEFSAFSSENSTVVY